MIELSCKELSSSIYDSLKEKTQKFIDKGNRAPGLAVVTVGDDEASRLYVKTKTEKAAYLGYVGFQYFLNGDSREDEVVSLIETLNKDDRVDGILLQLPLPKHLDEKRIIEHISSDKDVDGFTSANMGRMVKGEECFIPCTPKGILTILSHFGVSTSGKRITVVGRSDIVGKPLALLLMGKDYDATVSVANSKTKDLRALTLSSDIVISAVGKPMFLDSSYFSDGTVIIDVGINRISDPTRKRGWRTVGDVDRESLSHRDVSITPVPGGVGLMTVASLMENTFISRERRG